VSPQHQLTVHTLIFPSATDLQGLSVRRDELASPNVNALDMFGGVTSRRAFGNSTLLTLRAGALSHDSSIRQNGNGPSRLSPAGWRDNWFARVTRTAVRYSLGAALEKTIATAPSARTDSTRASSASQVGVGIPLSSTTNAATRCAPSALDRHRRSRQGLAYAAVRDLWRVNAASSTACASTASTAMGLSRPHAAACAMRSTMPARR
jgi:hypothetical protein